MAEVFDLKVVRDFVAPVVIKKRRRVEWTQAKSQLLLELHAKGMSHEEKADRMGRTPTSVKAQIHKLANPVPKSMGRVTEKRRENDDSIPAGVDPLPYVIDGLQKLGREIVIENGMYYLDGDKCNAQRLMVEYSNHLVAQGKKPVCRTTEWINA